MTGMIAEQDRRVIERFCRTLIDRGVPIDRVILFGSRARGDHEPGSDYDVLVVVNWVDSALYSTIMDCAWEVGARE